MTFHGSKHFNPYYRDETQKGFIYLLIEQTNVEVELRLIIYIWFLFIPR